MQCSAVSKISTQAALSRYLVIKESKLVVLRIGGSGFTAALAI